MAVEYKIHVNSMLTGTVGNLTDVVKQISYSITASDGPHAVSTSATTQLSDPDPANFIDFNNLTEAEVIGWLEGLEQTQVTKVYLADQLAKKISESQLQYKRAPWVPEPVMMPLPPAPENP